MSPRAVTVPTVILPLVSVMLIELPELVEVRSPAVRSPLPADSVMLPAVIAGPVVLSAPAAASFTTPKLPSELPLSAPTLMLPKPLLVTVMPLPEVSVRSPVLILPLVTTVSLMLLLVPTLVMLIGPSAVTLPSTMLPLTLLTVTLLKVPVRSPVVTSPLPAFRVMTPAVVAAWPGPPMSMPPEDSMSRVPRVPLLAFTVPVLTLPPVPTVVMKMLSAENRLPVLMPPLLSYRASPPSSECTVPSVMVPP